MIEANKIRELYKKLPEDIREVISSTEHLDKIQSIGKKFNLHIDQIGQMGEKILMVTMGLLKPQDFISELSKAIKLPADQTQTIAIQINEQIFAPIRESLKRVHTLSAEEGSEPAPAAKSGVAAGGNPLASYLSNNKPSDETPAPRPYTQDPYREKAE